MDPAVITVLSKLIGLGIAAHKAYESDGFGEEDLSALKAFLETGSGLLSKKGNEDRPVGAIQLALVVKAFGVAVGRHWAFNDRMVPGPSRLPQWLRQIWDSPRANRYREIELRLQLADLTPLLPNHKGDPVAELRTLQQITSQPLNSPYYRALWKAFSDPALDGKGAEPLLSLEKRGDARELEAYFRQAYIEALATADGRRVQQWHIELASEKTEALLHGLMLDMAGWGRRHVFGNSTTSSPADALPFIPLDHIYVEPSGRRVAPQEPANVAAEPIRKLIKTLLHDHRIVVVKADFGHGKSLTARILAKELADAWLTDNHTPGASLMAPVFISCARDISVPYDHSTVVCRALFHHAVDGLGVDLPMDESVFALPEQQQALFIFDGLDDVSLAPGELRELFARLYERMKGNGRALIFTRPGALDDESLPRGAPVVELLPFHDTAQVEAWLDRWNFLPARPPSVSLASIREAGLEEIAKVPILLLMIAMTLAKFKESSQAVDKGDLYEEFFSHIARGKLAQDRAGHGPIARASSLLLKCLVDRKIVPEGAQPVEAMLWLMSRVAWKVHEYTYRGKKLQSSEMGRILKAELGLNEDVQHMIELGLFLAIQFDPAKDSAPSQEPAKTEVLFSHPSFREFLVARYWLHGLRRLADPDARRDHGEAIVARLAEAGLMQENDAAFSMLQGMLGRLTDLEKRRIHSWAESVVNEDRLTGERLRDDRSSILRESALAVGSCLEAITIDDRAALRSMMAYFFLINRRILLHAPGLVSKVAFLPGVNLVGANLVGANLAGANLVGANLTGTKLAGANLAGAKLAGAKLASTNLAGADLTGADLTNANLTGANLRAAKLRAAKLMYTKLDGANLDKAELGRVDLAHATFSHTTCRRANLTRANLAYAKLEDTDLENANLTEANLQDVELERVNLKGVKGLDLTRISNDDTPPTRGPIEQDDGMDV